MKMWNDAQVKESFEKGRKVVTFFESSTIGHSDLTKVQEDLYGKKLGMLNFDVSSVEGETQLQVYMQVQQVSNDTDPLMWWKHHQQEFPDLSRMAGQYLTVPVTSASPERFFSRVGLVQTDLSGRILDTTMINLMWVKQAP